jgi:hypothetical protein
MACAAAGTRHERLAAFLQQHDDLPRLTQHDDNELEAPVPVGYEKESVMPHFEEIGEEVHTMWTSCSSSEGTASEHPSDVVDPDDPQDKRRGSEDRGNSICAWTPREASDHIDNEGIVETHTVWDSPRSSLDGHGIQEVIFKTAQL